MSVPPPDAAGSANTDLLQLVAAAADLCRRPLRHGVRPCGEILPGDCCLQLESRDPEGRRQPEHDLELEIFRSGGVRNPQPGQAAGDDQRGSLHLTLAWLQDSQAERPILWHGQHPVWMDSQGQRCPRPEGGEPLEALARRLRALLIA